MRQLNQWHSRRAGRSPWRRASAFMCMALAVSALAACGGSSTGPTGSAAASKSPGSTSLSSQLPASIRNTGTISVYLNSPYPPMEFSPPGSTNLEGFDVDLAKALARELGIQAQFVNVQFPALFTAVQSKRADMAISAIDDLTSRHGTFSFVDYVVLGLQLYTSSANASKYKSISQLCGTSVAIPTGTDFGLEITQLSKQQCAGKAGIGVVSVPTIVEQNLQITEGRASAALVSRASIGYQALQQPGRWALIGPTLRPTTEGIMVPKGSPLVRPLFLALQKLFQNGTYHSLLAKWTLTNGALSMPTVNLAPGQ